MNKIVTITRHFEVEIPDEKMADILADYRSTIDSGCIRDDLFIELALHEFNTSIFRESKIQKFNASGGKLKEYGIEIRNIGNEIDVFEDEL